MKIDRADPPRIVDESAPEALRELVRGERRSGPSDDAMGRMSKRLATAGVLAPTSKPPAVVHAERKLVLNKLGFVALAVAGGLVLSWRATEAVFAPNAPAPTPAMQVSADRASTEPTSRPAERAVERAPIDEPPEAAAIAVDDLPSATPRAAALPPSASAVASSVVRANAKGSGGSSVSGERATELELVQRAQSALTSDPVRALAIAGEHARAYPSGELVQEREVIAVEALSRLGRSDEALRRARALVQQFPRTPYATRLEVAIGRPLTAPDPVDGRGPANPPVTPAL